MSFRKRTIIVGALAALLVVLLTACDIGFWLDLLEPDAYLSFAVEWDYKDGDVDLYLTFPDDVDTTPGGTSPIYLEPYTYWAATDADRWDAIDGFWPEDGLVAPRVAVYWDNEFSAAPAGSRPAVQLTRDVRQNDEGPEIITVRGFPFTSNSVTWQTLTAADGLPADNYVWVGVMELYAYAFGANDKLSYSDGTGLDAVVKVYDRYDDKIAEFTIPAFTDVKGASIARINCFYNDSGQEYYQIVPDVRLIMDEAQIRGFGDATPTIVVEGGSRAR